MTNANLAVLLRTRDKMLLTVICSNLKNLTILTTVHLLFGYLYLNVQRGSLSHFLLFIDNYPTKNGTMGGNVGFINLARRS